MNRELTHLRYVGGIYVVDLMNSIISCVLAAFDEFKEVNVYGTLLGALRNDWIRALSSARAHAGEADQRRAGVSRHVLSIFALGKPRIFH